MRKISAKGFPNKPWMILLTSEIVSADANIYWADFKDTHALYHPKTQRFIGFDQDGRMLLGERKLHMVNGLWYLKCDEELLKSWNGIPALSLILEEIK